MGSQVVQEWADLATASSDETYVAEEDPVFQDDINRLCNVGLKAMLRDERREVSEWQDELNKVSHMLSPSLVPMLLSDRVRATVEWRPGADVLDQHCSTDRTLEMKATVMQRYLSTHCTRCQNTSCQQVRRRDGWTACVLIQTLSLQPAEPGTAEADRMFAMLQNLCSSVACT